MTGCDVAYKGEGRVCCTAVDSGSITDGGERISQS